MSDIIQGPYEGKDGYMRISVNRKMRLQHRYVLEQKLGRELKVNEHVHHIDGNRKNNNPDNLEIMNAFVHKSMHSKERANREENKEKLRQSMLSNTYGNGPRTVQSNQARSLSMLADWNGVKKIREGN